MIAYTRTGQCTYLLAIALTLVAALEYQAYGSHDYGETLDLIGASKDGRYVLVTVHDVQETYKEWQLHDVDAPNNPIIERFQSKKAAQAYVRGLKKRYLLRKPPKVRTKNKRERVEARFYQWIDAKRRRHRSFAIVGRLDQRIQGSWSLPCYTDRILDCDYNPRRHWLPALVHWFKRGVYLVATTWTVHDKFGDGSRAIFVHGRIPKPPVRPKEPPNQEGRSAR